MQNLCARAHVHKAQAQGAGSLSEGQSFLLLRRRFCAGEIAALLNSPRRSLRLWSFLRLSGSAVRSTTASHISPKK